MLVDVRSSQEAIFDLVNDPEFENLPVSIKESMLQLFFDMEESVDKENVDPRKISQGYRRCIYLLQNLQADIGELEESIDVLGTDETYEDWETYLANN